FDRDVHALPRIIVWSIGQGTNRCLPSSISGHIPAASCAPAFTRAPCATLPVRRVENSRSDFPRVLGIDSVSVPALLRVNGLDHPPYVWPDVPRGASAGGDRLRQDVAGDHFAERADVAAAFRALRLGDVQVREQQLGDAIALFQVRVAGED